MTDIPSWVVNLAGVFFLVQIVMSLCLIYLIFRVVAMVKEVGPKVEEISTKVKDIGDKVEALTESVKSTADTVGARAKSISGSAEAIAQTAATSFERFSPYVVAILSALRIIRAVQEFRSASQSHVKKKAPAASTEEAAAFAKVDRKGSK